MNVLILSTNIISGMSRWKELNESLNFYSIAICNPNKKFQFLLRQLFQLIYKLSFSEKIIFTKLLKSGKVKFLFKSIHSDKSINWIKNRNFDVGIHGLNTIYKAKLLKCFKVGILNAHLGLLPQFRGKSVVAWSIFENKPTGISTFIIDSGIDTGEKIILSKEISTSHCLSSLEAKKFLSSKTSENYKAAISILYNSNFTFKKNEISKGKRYYSMSDLFTSYVDKIMSAEIE